MDERNRFITFLAENLALRRFIIAYMNDSDNNNLTLKQFLIDNPITNWISYAFVWWDEEREEDNCIWDDLNVKWRETL